MDSRVQNLPVGIRKRKQARPSEKVTTLGTMRRIQIQANYRQGIGQIASAGEDHATKERIKQENGFEKYQKTD